MGAGDLVRGTRPGHGPGRPRGPWTEPLTTSFDRVVVTGAAGLIGRAVCRHLARVGVPSLGVGSGAPTDGPWDDYLQADLLDDSALDGLLDPGDGLVHLAAVSGGIQFQGSGGIFATNRRITDNVLRWAAEAEVRRTYLASTQVVYRPKGARLAEADPVVSPADRPNEYAWSKLTDEVVAGWWRDQGLSITVGRFGNVYGPDADFDPSRSTVVHALVRRFAEADVGSEVEVWGDGSAVRSLTFVDDAARGVWSLLVGDVDLANIDAGGEVSIGELAETIAQVVGEGRRPAFDVSKPGGVPYRVGDPTVLRSTGWEPSVSLREGIRRTYEGFLGA